jgi:hypothetical protein
MIRVRFYLPFNKCDNDYRPVIWPIKYPYWCSGENENSFILIAYLEDLLALYDQWPELRGLSDSIVNLEYETVDKIEYTSRFSKPDWYTDEYIKEYDPSKVKVYWTEEKKEKKSKREKFVEKFGHWWFLRELDLFPEPCEMHTNIFKLDGKWMNYAWAVYNDLKVARQASNAARKAIGFQEYKFKDY